MYNASVGKTLLLGIIIAIPAALIVGILFSKTKLVRNAKCSIPEGLTAERVFSDEEMPSFSSSLSIALVPVVLMAFNTFAEIILPKTSKILVYTAFFGDAPIALLIAVLISMIVLGIRRGKDSDEIMKSFSEGVKSVAMIILIIGAGVANYIKNIVGSLNVSPLILAWSIAATLRICIGSATVSVNAAAGIVLPLLSLGNVNPELMVLATASGSCICSHVNDPGFWMFKEYFNMPLSDAFRTRSTYTTILSLCGLAGVLILNIFI
jgi:gluconate transporter